MERARQARRAFAHAAPWPPVLLQGLPYRPPVLRGRFHHDYSRDPVRHRPLLGRAESVPRRINQGRELSAGLARAHATLNCSLNHARSGPHSCSASTAPLVSSISPLPTDIVAGTDFHRPSRAGRPTSTVAKSSQIPSHSSSVRHTLLTSVERKFQTKPYGALEATVARATERRPDPEWNNCPNPFASAR